VCSDGVDVDISTGWVVSELGLMSMTVKGCLAESILMGDPGAEVLRGEPLANTRRSSTDSATGW